MDRAEQGIAELVHKQCKGKAYAEQRQSTGRAELV